MVFQINVPLWLRRDDLTITIVILTIKQVELSRSRIDGSAETQQRGAVSDRSQDYSENEPTRVHNTKSMTTKRVKKEKKRSIR